VKRYQMLLAPERETEAKPEIRRKLKEAPPRQIDPAKQRRVSEYLRPFTT
jgi:hypothetical protein